MKHLAACGCLLAGLGVSSPSSADAPVRAALRWTADPSCTDAAGLRRAVDARLGRSTFSDDSPDVVVRGEVRRGGPGWIVSIELADTGGTVLGERVVESPASRCKELDDSIALVVALLVDIPKTELEQRRSELAAPPPVAPEAPEPPPAPVRARRLLLPKPPKQAPGSALDARLEALIAFGLLPDPAPGLSLGVLIDPDAFWAIDLEALVLAPQTLAERAGSVDFLSYGAALFVCPVRLPVGAGSLYACAGQRASAVRAEGRGFDEDRDQTSLLYQVGARVRLSLPLWDSLRLESAVGAELPLSRFSYFVTRENGPRLELFRQSAVIAAAQAGLGLFFR